MDTQTIVEAARATLAGSAQFPEIVGKLVRDQHTEWFLGAGL